MKHTKRGPLYIDDLIMVLEHLSYAFDDVVISAQDKVGQEPVNGNVIKAPFPERIVGDGSKRTHQQNTCHLRPSAVFE